MQGQRVINRHDGWKGDPKPGPPDRVGDDYSSATSIDRTNVARIRIGSQNLMLLPSNCTSSSVWAYSPISLKSTFIQSIRVSADFYSSARTATGTIRILSVPKSFSPSPWYEFADELTQLNSLFEFSNVKSFHNFGEKTDKLLSVIKGNVSAEAGVTCLCMIPLFGRGSEGLIGCEENFKEVDYDVPADRQIIILLTAFVWNARLGEVRSHVFVNVR